MVTTHGPIAGCDPRSRNTRNHFLTAGQYPPQLEDWSTGRKHVTAPRNSGQGFSVAHRSQRRRVALTRKLIDAGAPAIFEASFLADNTFVAVDVLSPQEDGFHLTEAKSSNSQKEEHLADAAVQVHVLERRGIRITGVDIMHLKVYGNRSARPLQILR